MIIEEMEKRTRGGETMKKIEKEEDKFIVVKREDFEALREGNRYHRYSSMPPAIIDILLEKDIDGFIRVLGELDKGNRYIVCNQDEPYAEEVWQLILEGERKKLKPKLSSLF